MFGVVISLVHLVRSLFCYSSFFFYTDDKEETNLIVKSSHLNFQLFLKIYVCVRIITSNKKSKCLPLLHHVLLLFIRSCCKRSEKVPAL